jgi:tetratricopeptide (TPR) repeat protein
MNPRAAIFAFALAASSIATTTAPAWAQTMRGAPRSNPAEYSAYRAFDSEPDPKAKIQLGEEFDQQYPLSRYRELVDSGLTYLYFNDQDWPKFYVEADKVIAISPKSVPVLELAGWVIPRHYNSHDPAAAAQLAKAENYEKRALAIIAAMKKPKQVTQQQFDDSKASLTWRAYSALGANYFRRKDFAGSAKNLQLAIKQESPEPDPGDLYILGVDFENLNRPSDAADIFAQCSQITSDMAKQCQQAYETASHQIVQTAEDAAFTAFSKAPNPDAKIRLGEAFDEKFPQSRYEERVDSTLINLYDHARNWEKLYATADRALAANPDNIPVLTFVGWVIPHLYDSSDPGGPAKLDESERYEKRALDLLPTLQKPPDATAGRVRPGKSGRRRTGSQRPRHDLLPPQPI